MLEISMNEIFQLNYQKYTSRYEPLETLAKGAFGTVIKANDKLTSNTVAVKIISKTHSKDIAIIQLKNEVCGLKKSNHPNIVKLFDFYETEQSIYIVMEYIKGGTLRNYIETHKKKITEKNAKKIIYYLLQAVDYLHKSNIIHRDIKLDNIMLNDPKDLSSLKLIDFGLSAQFENYNGEFCGTLLYMSPERLFIQNYTKESDIWSIGIIMHILLNGNHPFYHKGCTKEKFFNKVRDGEIVYSKRISAPAIDLLEHLLDPQQHLRYTASFALSHKWFFNIRELLNDNECDYNRRDIKNVGLSLMIISLLMQNNRSYKKLLEINVASSDDDDSDLVEKDIARIEEGVDIANHDVVKDEGKNKFDEITKIDSPSLQKKNKSSKTIVKTGIGSFNKIINKKLFNNNNLFLKANSNTKMKMKYLCQLTSRSSLKYLSINTVNANYPQNNDISHHSDIKSANESKIFLSPKKTKSKLSFNYQTERKSMGSIPQFIVKRESMEERSNNNSKIENFSIIPKKRFNSFSKQPTKKLKLFTHTQLNKETLNTKKSQILKLPVIRGYSINFFNRKKLSSQEEKRSIKYKI